MCSDDTVSLAHKDTVPLRIILLFETPCTMFPLLNYGFPYTSFLFFSHFSTVDKTGFFILNHFDRPCPCTMYILHFISFIYPTVDETGHVRGRAAQDSLFRHLPRDRHYVRYLVLVRLDRTHHRRTKQQRAALAILD